MLSGRNILITLAVKYQGDWQKIYAAINNKELIEEEEVENCLKNVKCNVLTILDIEDYPEPLKQVYQPPFVLFYYGDIKLLKEYDHNLAVIGSREFGNYGRVMTIKLVSEVSQELNIISGLARGIDYTAHNCAVNNGGHTIAVLGNGIDICYPEENKKLYEKIKNNQLIISEYPGTTPPSPNKFPARNRIIAGISKGVLVSEAYEHSGTLITVMYALQVGRGVMCVPYTANSNSECNRLIKNGAFLVESGKDILEIMK